MATQIKKYTKKDGTTAYMFKKYLGIDPITGKQRETTRRGFKSVKEAKLALSRLEVEIAENGLKQNKPIRTYSELCNDWFNLIYKKRVKESTFWNTKTIFDTHIIPVLGHLKVNKITVQMCQQYANDWSDSSPKRYKRLINYAGMVFKYAVSIGELKDNPMDNIIIPTIEVEEKKANFLSKEELVFFLEQLKQNWDYKRFAFFFLLSHTGMRKGEALAIQWRDIDLSNKTLTINKTLAVGKNGSLLVQTPKTKTSIRTIGLDDNTIEVLKQWKKFQAKELSLLQFIPSVDQLVFSKSDTNTLLDPGAPRNWLDTFYRKFPTFKRITVHQLRHTHASLLFMAKADMKQVQSRLGHSSLSTTYSVYTHLSEEIEKDTANLFADFMTDKNNLGQSLGQKKYPLD
ncbi:site-specific integrase [Vagococcus martis]|uniref:Site-specific integrase n=1 Tax=Vagococcus martis TaxID=1768210 RepID=A0A1V4DIP2_9ENTE|nr:site-specific integrase [Vagococcus martis]OPF88226.1 site-specific integrase [Vagococcus martis]